MRARHLLIGAGLGVLGLWVARVPLATAAADLYLRQHGVEGGYAIEQLSPSGLVLSNVKLGPGAAPDFRADRIEVALAGFPFAPRIETLRLSAPELRMSIVDGRPSFGTLDVLLPEPTGEPTVLPATRLDIAGGRLLAATPFGPLIFRIEGSGRLSDGFKAHAELEPNDPTAGSCRARQATGAADVVTAAGRLAITTGGTLSGAGCGTVDAHRLAWTAEATTDTGFERIEGSATLSAERLEGGFGSVMAPEARIRFAGSMAEVAGSWQASAGATRIASGALQSAGAQGTFAARPASGELTTRGKLQAQGVQTQLPTMAFAGQPILAALASPATAAARHFDVAAPFDLHLIGNRYDLRLPHLQAVAASGARLSLADGAGLRFNGNAGQLDGLLRIDGGRLPRATARFDAFGLGEQVGGQLRLDMGAWRAAGATVAVPDLIVRRSPAGLNARARLSYTGPISTAAQVKGLEIALGIATDPTFRSVRMDGACASVAFAQLQSSDMHLGAARSKLCPRGRLAWSDGALTGGLDIAPLAVRGSSSGQPLSLGLGEARLSFAPNRVGLRPINLTTALGTRRVRATLDGEARLDGSAGAGRVAGFALVGTDLPVRIDQGQAKLSLARGRWRLAGIEARVSDALPEARFQPLRVADATAMIEAGTIKAAGAGRLASSGERLFGFTLRHDLTTSNGSADLATGPLLFSDRLQPYQITEALRGVVENVAGRVEGTGNVRWTADSLESGGRVAVHDVSLATAALGPVTGIKGTVLIDDLFALTTPPGQVLTVASMNPGVLVEDGRFTFRMLGPTSAHVEDARWPFAGGTLTLRPVTISAGELRREFTLDVSGIDAGLFLQRFELEDVNATGTFDGTLPLVFDGSAGRVVGGTLTARTGGGLIQYVGDVGADSMGAAGRLAFDALKRMRYRSLSLSLDGDLDGELVTAVRFAGTNEAPVRPAGGVPFRAAGLPFKFNVTVRAPFRRLLGTAASFSDAREIIRSGGQDRAPGAPAPTPDAHPPVQPR